jgi:hypothetical protein
MEPRHYQPNQSVFFTRAVKTVARPIGRTSEQIAENANLIASQRH